MPREHTGQQTPSSNNTRKDSTHGDHQMINTEIRLIIFFAAKDGETTQSAKKKKKRPGTDCGSDYEILIAKFRLKLKKVGKATRPLRYDPTQIPYDYTAEVRNRFKSLELIDRLPDELWMEVHGIVQEKRDQEHPHGKEMQKAKWLSGEALQIAVKRRQAKS